MTQRDFPDELRAITGLDEEELDEWLNRWKKTKRTITQITGVEDHLLIAILLRDRAERWKKLFDRLIRVYDEFYTEWVDVALWCAYYEQLMNALCALTNTRGGVPLPDTDEFSKVALGLADQEVTYQPGGTYREIEGEVEEYNSAANSLKNELDAFNALGDVPSELSALFENFNVKLKELEIKDQVTRSKQVLPMQTRHEPLKLANLFHEEDMRTAVIVNQVTPHLENRDRLLGREVSVPGLLYIKEHIRDHYIPALDWGIEDLRHGLPKVPKRDLAMRERELHQAERVRDLLTHETTIQT